MRKQKEVPEKKEFRMEGDNGAEYLIIQETKPGRVFIEVGHSCVVYLRAEMPIEMITSALADAVNRNWESVNEWESEYADKLRSQCVRQPLLSPESPMFTSKKKE